MSTATFALRTTLLVACLGWTACGGGASVDPVTKARQDIATISEAVEEFADDTGSFPSALDSLVEPTASGRKYLDGFETVPRDPWGHPYRYLAPRRGSAYKVMSFGADGAPGGGGKNSDITAGPASI